MRLTIQIGEIKFLVVMQLTANIGDLRATIINAFHSNFPTQPSLIFFRMVSSWGVYLTDENPISVLTDGDTVTVERADMEIPKPNNANDSRSLLKLIKDLVRLTPSSTESLMTWRSLSESTFVPYLTEGGMFLLVGCLLLAKGSPEQRIIAGSLSRSRLGNLLAPCIPQDSWLKFYWSKTETHSGALNASPDVIENETRDINEASSVAQVVDVLKTSMRSTNLRETAPSPPLSPSPADCDIIKDLSKDVAIRKRNVKKLRSDAEYVSCAFTLGTHPDEVSDLHFDKLRGSAKSAIVQDIVARFDEPFNHMSYLSSSAHPKFREVVVQSFKNWLESRGSPFNEAARSTFVIDACRSGSDCTEVFLNFCELESAHLNPSSHLLSLVKELREDKSGFSPVLRLLRVIASKWETREWFLNSSPGVFDFLLVCLLKAPQVSENIHQNFQNSVDDVRVLSVEVLSKFATNFAFRTKAKRSTKLLQFALNPAVTNPKLSDLLANVLSDN